MRNFSFSEKPLVERRRHPRFKVRYFLIFDDDEKQSFGSVIDISQCGIGIVSSYDIPFREMDCSIKFSIGNYKDTDICLCAGTVWKKGIIVKNLYRSGLEISNIADPFRENFSICMRHLEEEDPGC